MNKSVDGIVRQMFYLELVVYLTNVAYNIHANNPISVWGENAFLAVQGSIIAFLVWSYNKDVGIFEKVGLFIFYVVYFTFLVTDVYVPVHLWTLLTNSSILIFICARGPQIIENFKNKSTGQLAFITFLLNFLGSSARIFTVLKETEDVFLLSTTLTAVTINFILTFQIILYWNSSSTTKVEEKPTKGKKKGGKKANKED